MPLNNPGRMMPAPLPAGTSGTSAVMQACQTVHVHRWRGGRPTTERSAELAPSAMATRS